MQIKRFVIENDYCKPKGLFLKDSDDRCFMEIYYFNVSKSGVKRCSVLYCFKRYVFNHAGYSLIGHLKIYNMFG